MTKQPKPHESQASIPRRRLLWLFIIIAFVIAIILLGEHIIDALWAASTGYEIGTPEYAIARAPNLPAHENSATESIIESDIIFAIREDPGNTGEFVVLAKDKDGIYSQARNNLQTVGNNRKIPYDVGGDMAIYYMDGKYICFVALPGFSLYERKDGLKPLVLENAEIKDNRGNTLTHIGGDIYRIYYKVADVLPDDYNVLLEYEDETYLLLDFSYEPPLLPRVNK